MENQWNQAMGCVYAAPQMMNNSPVDTADKRYVLQGENGNVFYIDQPELSIGRGESCSILLEEPTVSRLHTYLYTENERCYLMDAGSKNGTYLNGKQILEGQKCLLKDGDIISFSREVTFTFKKVEMYTGYIEQGQEEIYPAYYASKENDQIN